MAGRHTILLVQANNRPQSRTYYDYETVSAALDGICNMFEEKLRHQNPHMKQLSYDIADLYHFVDGMADMSALVFNPNSSSYDPHNKDWLKQRILAHLRKQVGQ